MVISVATDNEGYLRDHTQWNHSVAEQIAQQEQVTLTEEHWIIINYLRSFHQDHDIAPTMRVLVKHLKTIWTPEQYSSPYLYSLFPDGPVKQGSKIAGLPKPPHCI